MKTLTLPLLLLMAVPAVSAPPATGPLSPHPTNPRWLADPSGRAVLLAGSHNWQSLDKGEFNLDLEDAPGEYTVEWLDIHDDRLIPAGTVEGGASVTFTTPFPGPAALHVSRIP